MLLDVYLLQCICVFVLVSLLFPQTLLSSPFSLDVRLRQQKNMTGERKKIWTRKKTTTRTSKINDNDPRDGETERNGERKNGLTEKSQYIVRTLWSILHRAGVWRVTEEEHEKKTCDVRSKRTRYGCYNTPRMCVYVWMYVYMHVCMCAYNWKERKRKSRRRERAARKRNALIFTFECIWKIQNTFECLNLLWMY